MQQVTMNTTLQIWFQALLRKEAMGEDKNSLELPYVGKTNLVAEASVQLVNRTNTEEEATSLQL